MSAAIGRIRARGHWDVAVRPSSFDPDRVPYAELEDVLSGVVVRLRGWPVPFIDSREQVRHGPNWVGQGIDAEAPHQEAWRFFTTGQFNQLRVISADRSHDDGPTPAEAATSRQIEVWEILFYLTEVVELAARLALTTAGDDPMCVVARLRGLDNRMLISGSRTRELDHLYQSGSDVIDLRKRLPRDLLVADSPMIAVQLAQDFFLRFGFRASEQVLSDYQSELLGRR